MCAARFFPLWERRVVRGYVDAVTGLHISGWAANLADFSRTLIVEVLVDGETVAKAPANRHRFDLVHAGMGDGRHAFDCALPTQGVRPRPRARVQVRVADTKVYLPFKKRTSFELDSSVFIDYIAADLVNNCNLRCPFCLVDYSAVDKTELMSEETFVSLLRLIRSVPEAGFWLSCLHEPTLHPKLNRFLSLIPPDARNKVWFTTNLARPLSERMLEEWADSGLHHINISFDTMDPELFAVLRPFGKYAVFEKNLNALARIFRRHPRPPRLRYITMAFKSNLLEIPRLVAKCHEEWLASESEVRYTYNVTHIQDEFRKTHYLAKEDWPVLTAMLEKLPYPCQVDRPPEGYEENVQLSANYFDIEPPRPEPETRLSRPLTLRARPDGTLLLSGWGRERWFRVNVNDLEDPVRFFYERMVSGTA